MFNHQNYHFIGIGGIGISAIARMLNLQGKKVSGSDSTQSEITDDLGKLGIKITIGHATQNIAEDTEVVIYTIAATEDNPEIMEARKRGVPVISYPEALGELSKKMFTIAVSGTHGKTTTTAMIGHILMKAGLDPTIVVGSKMLSAGEKNTNFVAGKSNYFVVEACEYKRSFLNLHPTILVITNIEADHLDYYKDLDDIKSAFAELSKKVPENGFIVTENEYKEVSRDFELSTPGEHNILDAQAAIKVAEILGIPQEKAKEFLKDFRGTWRRLEYKGEKDGNIFYDDYAHHPTEIEASLSALKQKYPDKILVAVFEAHQQSRTKILFSEFVNSLSIADQVFIAPIFITREVDDGVTTNNKLANAINKTTPAKAIEHVEELKTEIEKIDSSKPLCIVLMGAGNIYKWTDELI